MKKTIAETKTQIMFVNVNEENEAEEGVAANEVEEAGLVDEETAGEAGMEEEMIEIETLTAGEGEEEEVTTDDHSALLDLHRDVAILESVIPSDHPLQEDTNPIFHKDEVAVDRMIVIGGGFPFLGHHQMPAQSLVRPAGDAVPPQDLVLHHVVELHLLKDDRTHIVEVAEAEEETGVQIDDHVEGALVIRMILFRVLRDLRKDGQLQDLQVLRHHLDLAEHGEILGLLLRQDLLHPTERKGLLVRQMMLQSRELVEAVNVTIVG